MFEHVVSSNGLAAAPAYTAESAEVCIGNIQATVPPEVHVYSGAVPQMAAGTPGKVGLLQLEYEKIANATRLARAYHQAPLYRSRPLYLDPAWPEMVFTYVVSLGGGIIQGDRLGIEVNVAANATVHLTTQSATKAYRMEHDYAVQLLRFNVGANAVMEWIPDPLIPYRNSRLFQETNINLHPSATIVFADMWLSGREGEPFTLDVLYNRVRVTRDGCPIILDSMCLAPAVRSPQRPGAMSTYTVFGTLYIVSPLVQPDQLAETLHRLAFETEDDVLLGFSVLPYDAGIAVRCVGASPRLVRQALLDVWNAARVCLFGRSVPGRIYRS